MPRGRERHRARGCRRWGTAAVPAGHTPGPGPGQALGVGSLLQPGPGRATGSTREEETKVFSLAWCAWLVGQRPGSLCPFCHWRRFRHFHHFSPFSTVLLRFVALYKLWKVTGVPWRAVGGTCTVVCHCWAHMAPSLLAQVGDRGTCACRARSSGGCSLCWNPARLRLPPPEHTKPQILLSHRGISSSSLPRTSPEHFHPQPGNARLGRSELS